MSYTPTIGLEIHAELNTKTKMFCNSLNNPNEAKPNTNICPVCMGHPGTLPVANREAVHQVLRVGTAIGGELADFTEFDRKNYFYPDLPKGYQISQYQYPLVSKGTLRGVQITRIHLEEDTARSQHEGGDTSVVDFNRAGVPLMELVTEPCIHDAQTASLFAQELQLLLRYLGASEANMEKGQMRVEANISISKGDKLGTKVEVKNLNSFKSVEKAIAYELKRQEALLESGGSVTQETRGWDEVKLETFSQRVKESSNDYRYFPDPDIPKLNISRIAEFSNTNLVNSLPELPWDKRARYKQIGLNDSEAEILVSDRTFSTFVDTEITNRLATDAEKKTGINYLLSDVRGHGVTGEALEPLRNGYFAAIIRMISDKSISSKGAKMLIEHLLKEGGDPQVVAKAIGVMQVSDGDSVSKLIDEILKENSTVEAEVRAGKIEAMKFLIGQGMKKSKGSINPGELERLLKEKLIG